MSAYNADDIKAVVDATHQWGEPLTEAEALQILTAVSDQIAARALREAAEDVALDDSAPYNRDDLVRELRARADRLDGAE